MMYNAWNTDDGEVSLLCPNRATVTNMYDRFHITQGRYAVSALKMKNALDYRRKRFREDEVQPKESVQEHVVENNHYGQKMSHFQGTPLGGTPASNLAAAGIELITLEKMNVTSKRRLVRRKTWVKQTQINIFRALERPRTTLAYCYHGFVFALILASLSLSVVVTCKGYDEDKMVLDSVYYLEISLVLVFTLEYVLRIWSCSCHGNYKGIWGKMRFIKKPYMVIDIIVIVATTAVISTTKKEESKADYFSVSLLRFLRFLQVLRVLRIDRQQGAFKMVSNVLYDHRQELITCCYMTFILIVSCSFLVYLAEKSDDTTTSNEMEDLSDGIYWGFITLSTIGYGDFSPQNAVAKWITVIFSFVGTAFFALPAGILGSGFAIQVAQNQKQKHINRRRHPAAVLIQYAWRNYAAHPYIDSNVTWKRHQMRTFPKDNRYSVYTGNNDTTTPTSTRKSFAYLRKKFNSGRNSSYLDTEGFSRSRRSSIGATIPSALELRDRCQSEGNLLLVSPNNVEDNQATIVSLPQSVITDFVGVNPDKLISHSNQDVYLKPLNELEKNAIRFIRRVKFLIAVRKFREQLRPYDIKDVLEQYSEGQMEMFSFMKKCQGRIEGALGLKDNNKINNQTLIHRVSAVERKVRGAVEKLLDRALTHNLFQYKVDTLDEKLDVVLQLLRKDIPAAQGGGILPGGPTGGVGLQYAYNVQNPYGVDTATPSERFETPDNPPFFLNPHADKKPNEQLPADELKKKLELLHSEYNSMSGNESCFSDKGLKGKADYASHNSIEEEEIEIEAQVDENIDDDDEEDDIPTDELFNASRVVDVDIHPSRIERAESSREREASLSHDGDERRGSAPPHVCRSNSRFTVTPSKIGPDKDMFFGDSCDAVDKATNCDRPRNMSHPSLETLEFVRRCSQSQSANNSNNNSNHNLNTPPVTTKNCKHASLSSINWNNSAMSGIDCTRNNMKTRFNSVPMLFDSSKNVCVTLNGQAGVGGGRNSPIVINESALARPSQPVFNTDNNIRSNGNSNNVSHCNGKRSPCKGRSLSTETSAESTPTLSRLFAPKDSALDNNECPAVIPNGISETVCAET